MSAATPLIQLDYSGLRKIISGGQDGVDIGGLKAAFAERVETGGMAPKGFRTARGSDPTLMRYGLIESTSPLYPPRTKENVKNSDGTLIITCNIDSKGTALTIRYANELLKPYFVVQGPPHVLFSAPADNYLIAWILSKQIEVLNVAGNHKPAKEMEQAAFCVVSRMIQELARQKKVVKK